LHITNIAATTTLAAAVGDVITGASTDEDTVRRNSHTNINNNNDS